MRSIIKLKYHFAKVARGVIFLGDFWRRIILRIMQGERGKESELSGSSGIVPFDIGRLRELPEQEMEKEIKKRKTKKNGGKRERERKLSDYFPTRILLLFRVCLATLARTSLRSHKLAKQSAGSATARKDRRCASLVYMLNISRSCPLFSAARIDFIGFRVGEPSRIRSVPYLSTLYHRRTVFTRDNSDSETDRGDANTYGSTLTKSRHLVPLRARISQIKLHKTPPDRIRFPSVRGKKNKK